jgi:hypothetical protein
MLFKCSSNDGATEEPGKIKGSASSQISGQKEVNGLQAHAQTQMLFKCSSNDGATEEPGKIKGSDIKKT